MLIPKINSEDDIYKLGSLAAIKAIHDPNNPFLPYNLNMFPQKKAELTSFVDPVACLARVTTRDIAYPELDSSTVESIHTKFMISSVNKLLKIVPDEKFREVLKYLTAFHSEQNPEYYMYMVLTMLSMPQFANPYRFLINLDKH